jgi:hypothetical protein
LKHISEQLEVEVPENWLAIFLAKLALMQYIKFALILEIIKSKVVTLDISKLFIFKDINELQPSNILSISVTNDVLKLLISKDVNNLQLENNPYIFFTDEVSK